MRAQLLFLLLTLPLVAAAPWLEENFSQYTDTTDLLSFPNVKYSNGEDVYSPGEIVLDTTTGYGASTKSMRYNFPDRTASTSTRCNDYTIGRNINLPASTTEVWLEVTAKFQAGFKTAAPPAWGCMTPVIISNPAYKFIFGRVTPSSRYQWMVGGYATEDATTVGYPGNEEPSGQNLPISPANIFDGQWHTYRIYMKAATSGGRMTAWRDGALFTDLNPANTPANTLIYGIALGRNMNQGPGAPQSMWWGDIKIYNTDPGWSGTPPVDTTPPVRSNGAPSGTLASGTTSTTLTLTTDEAATCKYSNSAGTAYASMSNTFNGAQSTSHSIGVSGLVDGQTYYRYVRCIDAAGNANTNDYTITYSVANPSNQTNNLLQNFTRIFYSTLDSAVALSSPQIGTGAGASVVTTPANDFLAANNGSGLHIDASGEYARVQETNGVISNVNLSKGAADFWYQPTYSHTDGVRHYLLSIGSIAAAPGGISIQKSNAANGNNIEVQETDSSGALLGASINPASYSWNPGDWVHITFTWDFTVAPGVQNVHIYVDGIEGTYPNAPSTGPHTMSNPSQTQYIYIGNRDATAASPASGIIDDLSLYTAASGGLSPPSQRPGDLNDDNRVDFNDMLIIIGQFRKSGAQITNTRADLNNDGTINLYDFILTSKHWGQVYP